MAQRTRKILLWDGSYTKPGAFGDCNAKNKEQATISRELRVAPNVGMNLVVPKIGARLVSVDRFVDIERRGRKAKKYAAITVDLKGIAAIESLLLVVYPRAGKDGLAQPVYREVNTGNDKILQLIAGKTHAHDKDPTLPKPPAKAVEARYKDTPFTVKVWVSTSDTIDVDALSLEARVFASPEVLGAEEKFPALAHDKSLPHKDNFHSEKKTYEAKTKEVERSRLGRNQISCPLHEDLKLVFIKTTHTVALPALDRAAPDIKKKLDELTLRTTEATKKQVGEQVEQAKKEILRIKGEILELEEKGATIGEELRVLKLDADEAIKKKTLEQRLAQKTSDELVEATEELDVQKRREADQKVEELRKELDQLKEPIAKKASEQTAVQYEIKKRKEELEIHAETASQDPEAVVVNPRDGDFFAAYPEEYKRAVKGYLEGLEDRSAAAFDHHVLRKVPMGGSCPKCKTEADKLYCQHRLDLERFTHGSDSPESCSETALTAAQKLGGDPDTIGDGGTTRTNFDDFMKVFCDSDGGKKGALSPIEGLLFTITDDNYAHNVAAAAAYKALIQRGSPGAKRLVINFDQHIDCGDNKFVIDEDGQVKITCATWGQFMYYESPDPSAEEWKDKLKTPFAPKGKPIANGYVAVGTLITDRSGPARQNQMRDFRAIAENATLPKDAALHELEVNPAAAVLRRSDGTPGSARTVKTFGEKTFKGAGLAKRYQLCGYKDLLAGADTSDDKDPKGVSRVYYCHKCKGDVVMTAGEESPKVLTCGTCGATESRQGLEDVYFDSESNEADWSKWHVFITIDRDFFIGNGTGWNDGRNGSHKGRDLVLKCIKYLVDRKAKIVGLDLCGVPDKKGVATSKFFGDNRPYEELYSQLAEDVRTFCLQLDEMMYAAEEKRSMDLLSCDATWKLESWIPKLDGADGAPPPRNPDSVLRHDGLYVHFQDGSESKTLLRFYEDGVVLSIAVEASAPLPKVAEWFKRDDRLKHDRYELSGVDLSFLTTELGRKAVEYRGKIEGNSLALDVHSHLNDRDFKDTFWFTPMKLA